MNGQRRCRRREVALRFLGQLAVRWSGYRVAGVYGWAHADDFRELTGDREWAGWLAALAREGVADVHDARPADAADAAPVYRITQAGMNDIARVLAEPAPVVREPDAGGDTEGVYVSAGARWALDALREAPGAWMSAARVKEPSERWNCAENRGGHQHYRWVYEWQHLGELVAAGLAECRSGPEGKVYRATTAGLAARPLQWSGPDPEHPIYTDRDGSPLLVQPLRCSFLGSGNQGIP